VMVELENTDGRSRAVELTLFEDALPIDVRPLELPARSKTTHFFALGASGTKFVARVAGQDGAKDALPLDDEARVTLPQRRARRVLLVTEGQRYLESALALDRTLEVVQQKPANYRSTEGFDVAIFDRFVPSTGSAVPVLWIAPAEGGPFRITGSLERPFFDEVAADSPLLKSLSLRDVNVRRAQRVELEAGDQVLGRSKQGPLVVQGTRAGQPFLALTFDARESDLVLRTAWPMLLARAIQQLTAAEERMQRVAATANPEGTAQIAARRFAERAARDASARGSAQPDLAWRSLVALALFLLAFDAWRMRRRRSL
jgi:Ca-activated chloride channel homolog